MSREREPDEEVVNLHRKGFLSPSLALIRGRLRRWRQPLEEDETMESFLENERRNSNMQNRIAGEEERFKEES